MSTGVCMEPRYPIASPAGSLLENMGMGTACSLLAVRPGIPAPLDPAFIPPVLARRAYRDAVRHAPRRILLNIAVERENGLVSRGDLDILEPSPDTLPDTLRIVERHLKFMLWAWGGWKIVLSGPAAVCDPIRRIYSTHGARAFDVELMQRVYDRTFEVVVVDPSAVPESKASALSAGGHLDGCRIGFDLGASDYKLAAVVEGESVFSTEIPWQPVTQKDPAYHYGRILGGLKLAASQMPRLDAIGGSSAGILVDNRIKVASLFRAVPEAVFQREVPDIFLRLQKEFGVPLRVMNDGDVTALAGAMSLRTHAILGVAMGSSEATGYLDRNGALTGCVNELGFGPADFSEAAVADEWSGDIGVGAQYFSQQAVNKLAPAAGMSFPSDMLLPERLVKVQERANRGDKAALEIFETIGVYLGYTVPLYTEYYDFSSLLVLGRVTSGRGGEVLIEKARDVMKREFPETAERVTLQVPDEKSRRVGQAVAAASLPELRK